jgi:NADPH:quinone reductase-like Zn-dependent oxidoreductase
MRAALIREHGGPEAIEIAEVPKPEPQAGEVLVQVKAAGMNHLDTWVRRGLPGRKLPLPMILGADAAGIAAEVAPGAHGVVEGDRVFVAPGFSCTRCVLCLSGEEALCRDYGIFGEHRNGTQAEYIAVPSENIMALPEGLSFEEGAAFPLVFLTSWHMLIHRARLRPGEDVLIHAGGSGIGTASIQIAKLYGARVITTVGTDDKAERARALGADEAINYRQADFCQEVRRLTGKRGVDVVVENVGQETWDRSIRSLTRGGRLVTCGATTGYEGATDIRYVFFKGLSILGSTMGSRSELLHVARFMAEGKLRPVIDRVLPLDRIAEGHRAMAERSLFGKIVLTP